MKAYLIFVATIIMLCQLWLTARDIKLYLQMEQLKEDFNKFQKQLKGWKK